MSDIQRFELEEVVIFEDNLPLPNSIC
ncbi:hypothetical protein XBO1_2490014 [Xenorhabdus bovienii str. oregonense]|uniref:Uncharacterized protein n=1 Tax=Xenorhabdus bovienii str. oregonense TaxID=1398202 RepID=A0A077P6V3_XENBV|nr:hypothetical protein XBO1_2490014 [Xenorhabdus bovienii str. oregonense]